MKIRKSDFSVRFLIYVHTTKYQESIIYYLLCNISLEEYYVYHKVSQRLAINELQNSTPPEAQDHQKEDNEGKALLTVDGLPETP